MEIAFRCEAGNPNTQGAANGAGSDGPVPMELGTMQYKKKQG